MCRQSKSVVSCWFLKAETDNLSNYYYLQWHWFQQGGCLHCWIWAKCYFTAENWWQTCLCVSSTHSASRTEWQQWRTWGRRAPGWSTAGLCWSDRRWGACSTCTWRWRPWWRWCRKRGWRTLPPGTSACSLPLRSTWEQHRGQREGFSLTPILLLVVTLEVCHRETHLELPPAEPTSQNTTWIFGQFMKHKSGS